MEKLNVAVVGLGSMGKRWAKVARLSPETRLKLIIDTDRNKAKEVKNFGKCEFDSTLEALTYHNIDAVVVATPNAYLAPVTQFALSKSIHVLCEKPGGISPREVSNNYDIAAVNRLAYMIGFNHRFHPALSYAQQIVSSGLIGQVHFIRGVYGHGARPGYDKEWRCDRKLSGGGELLDQGIHLIDLAHWFLKSSHPSIYWDVVCGVVARNYWTRHTDGVEDDAFLTLQSNKGTTVLLHASWTQWKPKFLWEVFGIGGYVIVEGLGGRYGTEKVRFCKRYVGGSSDKEIVMTFPPRKGFEDPDISLFNLWKEFVGAVKGKVSFNPHSVDALRALEVVERVYQQGGAKQ